MTRRTMLKVLGLTTLSPLCLEAGPGKDYQVKCGQEVAEQLKEWDGYTVNGWGLELDVDELDNLYHLAEARGWWNSYEQRPHGGHWQAANQTPETREQYKALSQELDELQLFIAFQKKRNP